MFTPRDVHNFASVGITSINPGVSQNLPGIAIHVQAEILERQILELIEKDPVGAACSWIGRTHLQRYGFLRPNADKDAGIGVGWPSSKYPFQFELGDVLLEGKEITTQLIAMEYCEDYGETTPYTIDALIVADEAEARRDAGPIDPFTTHERPDTNVRIVRPDGREETVNLAGKKVEKAPDLKEVGDAPADND